MALILIIECTSFNYSIALGDSGVCIQFIDRENINPTTYLSQDINSLLSECNKTVESLDGIALDMGPGSYSSLRSAISLVKGFVAGLEIPIIALEKDFIIFNSYRIKEIGLISSISSLKDTLLLSYWDKAGELMWKDKIYRSNENLDCLDINSEIQIIGEKTESIQLSNNEFKVNRRSITLKANQWVKLADEQYLNSNFVNHMSLVPKYLFDPSTTQAKNLL